MPFCGVSRLTTQNRGPVLPASSSKRRATATRFTALRPGVPAEKCAAMCGSSSGFQTSRSMPLRMPCTSARREASTP